MIIFIAGFPGSGKSTIGKQLAQIINFDFMDLDDLIKQREQMEISQVFKEKGEDYFREIESLVLMEQINNKTPDRVLALGGGTMSSFDHAETITMNGICIYLQVPLQDILNKKDVISHDRPLFEHLEANELENKMRTLYRERERYYHKSQLEALVNSGFSTIKLARKVKLLTNRSQSL